MRQTDQGKIIWVKFDAAIGRFHPGGAIFQPYLNGGLWDPGPASRRIEHLIRDILKLTRVIRAD